MKLCVYCSTVVTRYDSRYRCRNCHRWLDHSEVLDLNRLEGEQQVETVRKQKVLFPEPAFKLSCLIKNI